MEYNFHQLKVKKNKLFFVDFRARDVILSIKNNENLGNPVLIIRENLQDIFLVEKNLNNEQLNFWIWFSFICSQVGEYGLVLITKKRSDNYIIVCED